MLRPSAYEFRDTGISNDTKIAPDNTRHDNRTRARRRYKTASSLKKQTIQKDSASSRSRKHLFASWTSCLALAACHNGGYQTALAH
jgi:hypothetical protein